MEDDERLLELTEREPEAFGRFYARHERAVLGFFMRRVRDPEVAADLCAETFAAALVGRRGFRPERGTPSAWLFGIAHNQLLQWLRRQAVETRARQRLGLLDLRATEAQLSAVAAIEDDIVTDALLRELPEDQASAVRDRVLGDASYAAMAASADVSEATVRKRVSRGLAALRPFAKESR